MIPTIDVLPHKLCTLEGETKLKEMGFILTLLYLSTSWLAHWCAIGVGTSPETLGWCGTLLATYIYLCIDTMHLKYRLVLFGYVSSTLTLPPFLLSFRSIMLCRCSSIMTKNHFLVIFSGTKWLLCADVPLKPRSLLIGQH